MSVRFGYSYLSDLKNNLLEAFDSIVTSGSFAAWGELPTTPPTGLYVEGVGEIGMPLTDESIRKLINKSHQAPFGRRSDTLIDLSVRNTWEINGDQLRFLDPAWTPYLNDISKRVGTFLGIEGPIILELYKMLIYEKGAMFKAHTDTQRTPGMFGTLIICLPAAHTGGEVVVRHSGEQKTLKTSDASQSFACWYSDVTHEVLPVTSGYRCVLTYNLLGKPGHTWPAAIGVDLQKCRLQELLQNWLRDLDIDDSESVPSHIYHALDYEYTEAAISFEVLKAEDFARVQSLQALAGELHFEVFLVLLEYIKQGETEVQPPRNYNKRGKFIEEPEEEEDFHYIEEVLEETFTVKSLHALDGTIIARDYRFDLDSCLLDDPFEDTTCLKEDFESYQGNWGPSACQWYRRSALVIVPHKKSLTDYLGKCFKKKSSNNPSSILGYLAKACSIPSAPKPLLDTLVELFGRKESDNVLEPETIGNLLKAALRNSLDEIFKTVGNNHQDHLPVQFFDWAKEWLTSLPEADRAEKYTRCIPPLIKGYSSVSKKLITIEKMSDLTLANSVLDPSLTNISKPWAQDLTRQCADDFCKTTPIPTAADGSAVVSAVLNLNETWACTSDRLKSIFGYFPQPQSTAFVLSFLSRLKTLGAISTQHPISKLLELRRSLSSQAFNRERTPSNMIIAARAKTATDSLLVVTPQALVQFVCDLEEISTETNDLVKSFIEALSLQCLKFTAEELRQFWMPFLYQLISTLVIRSINLNNPCYQQLTLHLIRRLDAKTLGKCPQAGINPRSPQVNCDCEDCWDLNEFLRDSAVNSIPFKVAKNRRDHIQEIVTKNKLNCNHYVNNHTRPLTITISKQFTLQRAIREWKDRQKTFYATITDNILPDHLQSLLGIPEFKRIRALAGLPAYIPPPPPTTTDTSSSSTATATQ
ncbi:hypothetical protein MJO28_008622 [Puccinia striiformis f. sp. tritici]|uniref:Prolyl 4-hydroxylase alpha subunit Fe(2+) 2OG dioxygenase domain-containing protein n=4 Tax=Puccinia striiformis TaxID=27350 RepID=A0A0L0VKI2_9BASI|nr:hypothetical protein Pst134EB_016432 [Puccinia striiformis f. sp. tritici]KNE99792.1 hypothetical protein PSTG_06884 [Puccinia striiformis f. sp. tritici PST-78]POW04181.1 hypothetical protein PSTT_10582 [Puccinia striiformis]KAI7949791.1 hypothetical protein MJO28_008612 [Puccinia striiformis f. sp. tritici]KAI7949801.1 hypothetical protein MJO28_008622 [Puccinia striiformis f. sp. tritici]